MTKAGSEDTEPPEGTSVKHMGVQENQNCTVSPMRMKHRRNFEMVPVRCESNLAKSVIPARK